MHNPTIKNAYRLFVGKPRGKRQLWRPRRRPLYTPAKRLHYLLNTGLGRPQIWSERCTEKCTGPTENWAPAVIPLCLRYTRWTITEVTFIKKLCIVFGSRDGAVGIATDWTVRSRSLIFISTYRVDRLWDSPNPLCKGHGVHFSRL
jgi:hypothetical protein